MLGKVLVIDDDATITQVLSLLLKAHGFNVLTSNSGLDGLKLVRTESPAVIILDLMMPGMDGWEVCRQARAFTRTPILVLSAVSDHALIEQARNAGADEYLIKPVPSEILVSRLKSLMRQAA